MKKYIIWAALLLACLSIIIPKLSTKPKSALQSLKQNKPISVKYNLINMDKLEPQLNLTGTLIPNEYAVLSSAISGRVTGVYFEDGAKVSKGTLLVKIDDQEQQADLKKIQLTLDNTNAQLNRLKQLESKGAISVQELDNLKNERDKLLTEKNILSSRIAKTEIRAPFNGTLGLKDISIGKYVVAGERVVDIQDLSQMKIDFTLSEQYLFKIKPNDKFKFWVEGMTDTLLGSVKVIEPKVDIATRTIKVRGVVKPQKHLLIPGTYATIKLDLSSAEPSILIPSETLIPELSGYSVMIAEQDTAKKIPVKIGKRLDTKVQIIEGLQLGDTLISSGLMQVKHNSLIKLIH